jgi:hypothetical protein
MNPLFAPASAPLGAIAESGVAGAGTRRRYRCSERRGRGRRCGVCTGLAALVAGLGGL